MKILLTGYLGFIGKNFHEKLLKLGHEVIPYSLGEIHPDVKGCDLVIHLGAISSTTENNVEKILSTNLDYSIKLFHQCYEEKVNLQWASSASIYGIDNTTFNELDLVNPQSPYSWSKYLFERYIDQFLIKKMLMKEEIPITVQGFRYFNVYGPYENGKYHQSSPYHKFSHQAQNDGVIELFIGSDNFKRDFIHVDQVFDLQMKFINIPESGIWNIGTGKATSFEEIAIEISNLYNSIIKLIEMPENISKQYQTYTCADLAKLNNTLLKYNLI